MVRSEEEIARKKKGGNEIWDQCEFEKREEGFLP